jgi:hypothetical protein
MARADPLQLYDKPLWLELSLYSSMASLHGSKMSLHGLEGDFMTAETILVGFRVSEPLRLKGESPWLQGESLRLKGELP